MGAETLAYRFSKLSKRVSSIAAYTVSELEMAASRAEVVSVGLILRECCSLSADPGVWVPTSILIQCTIPDKAIYAEAADGSTLVPSLEKPI